MKKALLIVVAVALAVWLGAFFLTTPKENPFTGVVYVTQQPEDATELANDAEEATREGFDIASLEDKPGRWDRILPDMPEPTQKLRIHMPGRLAEVFNDSNYVQWAAGESIGIKPISDTRSYFNPGRDIVKVSSCKDFYVEELRHSHPYLVPEAAETLHEIGRRFNDSLAARGGGPYRIRVTSVLRTPDTVEKLRKANANAVDSSVHQLGTTFDISYARFACHDVNGPNRSAEDLKNLLGEVLLAMRREGKVWVKFERKQPCYHITARPRK